MPKAKVKAKASDLGERRLASLKRILDVDRPFYSNVELDDRIYGGDAKDTIRFPKVPVKPETE